MECKEDKQPASSIQQKELENILYGKNISIWCLLEIHLNAEKAFKMQDYQCSDLIDKTEEMEE